MLSKKFFVGLKEYALITMGVFLFVLGWCLFLLPNNLIGGGVSGLASIVQYATKGVIKVGYTYFVVNIGLVLAALFVLGKGFGWKTVYAIIITAIGLNYMQGLLPADIVQALAVDNGKLMSTIMGGMATGCGIGLTMSNGGSTGGTDIVALIVNKYRSVSPGRMILFLDTFIILSSLAVPSYSAEGIQVPFTEKITTVVYGFILVFLTSFTLDMYLAGSKKSVQLFILSKKYDQIADAITHDLHRGVTVLDGKGWYTKSPTEVLMVLTRRTDLNILLKTVKSIDPDAFLSVSSVTGVFGKGFDTIKK